jgi:two-component system chemotaxis response regulator CheY
MGRRLLITDDSMVIRQLIRDAAEAVDWTIVGEAANGDEAIEMFRSLRPDVTTLDLVMPVHDGLHALRGIRAIDPTAKILVVSAINQTDVLKEAIRLGAADFIVKPFRAEQVASALACCGPTTNAGQHALEKELPS